MTTLFTGDFFKVTREFKDYRARMSLKGVPVSYFQSGFEDLYEKGDAGLDRLAPERFFINNQFTRSCIVLQKTMIFEQPVIVACSTDIFPDRLYLVGPIALAKLVDGCLFDADTVLIPTILKGLTNHTFESLCDLVRGGTFWEDYEGSLIFEVKYPGSQNVFASARELVVKLNAIEKL